MNSSKTKETVEEKEKEKEKDEVPGLVHRVLSWSLSDIMNKDLYKNKVKKIPDEFSSAKDYLSSFVDPLIEETHSDLRSCVMTVNSSPICAIYSVKRMNRFEPPGNLEYLLEVDTVPVSSKKQPAYEPEAGDVFAITDVIPECIDDLNRPKRSYTIAYVLETDEEAPNRITIFSSKPISFRSPEKFGVGDWLCAVYLTNLTTNLRIWNALHPGVAGYMEVINSVLHYDPTIEEDCLDCLSGQDVNINFSNMVEDLNTLQLDESQMAAASKCLALTKCLHRNSVKLIWGPPGTGKSKTIASLGLNLLKMKCSTVICAPTNIAVVGVAKRLMHLRDEMEPLRHGRYGLGDIVLYGNPKKMKIDEHGELLDVFLHHRVSVLARCFAPLTGWKATLHKMISLLEYPNEEYQLYLIKQMLKPKDYSNTNTNNSDDEFRSVEEFFVKKFIDLRKELHLHINGLCTHMPTSLLSEETQKQLIKIQENLGILGSFAKSIIIDAKRCLKSVLTETAIGEHQLECLSLLKVILDNFQVPELIEHHHIQNFCLVNVRLVFCTVSSSARLQTVGMKLAVVDEAAQLKECESCILLQLRQLRHVILVGDEKQLPAMVASKICERAGFGRSLFERLVMLGKNKHLLNVQYRMHPNISLFPNGEFYRKQITNGQNVLKKSYNKRFLPEKLFGSYSFININSGKEEFDNSRSLKNLVEVHVVAEIVSKLYKECIKSKTKIRVGCISPYKAQVSEIQKSFESTYSTDAKDMFSVNVLSVDGFQGGEEDVIIISTVRSNGNGSIGFLSNHQRTNVALTRARYCLWILGNEGTMLNSHSIWQKLVVDAKNRSCFYNLYEDKCLCLTIGNALIELNQMQSLLSTDSEIFKASKWKVFFGAKFNESITRIHDVKTCKSIFSLLIKLSEGWRQHSEDKMTSMDGDAFDHPLLEWCDIDEQELKLVWTTDILCEYSTDTQVIKILDVVPQKELPAHAKTLCTTTQFWSARELSRCMYKHVEGGLTLPMSWTYDTTRKLDFHNRFLQGRKNRRWRPY